MCSMRTSSTDFLQNVFYRTCSTRTFYRFSVERILQNVFYKNILQKKTQNFHRSVLLNKTIRYILQNHSTELFHRIILQNISSSQNGSIEKHLLQNHSTDLESGATQAICVHSMHACRLHAYIQCTHVAYMRAFDARTQSYMRTLNAHVGLYAQYLI